MSIHIQVYLVLLHFIILCRCCDFYKLKVCGNPALSESTGTIIFPTAFDHFLSFCHMLVILAIFQTFSLLSYVIVIRDL